MEYLEDSDYAGRSSKCRFDDNSYGLSDYGVVCYDTNDDTESADGWIGKSIEAITKD